MWSTLRMDRWLSSRNVRCCGRPYTRTTHGGTRANDAAGRMPGAVARRRDAEHPAEAGRERADALQADGEADPRHRPVGRAQQGGRPLEAPRQQVLVRRLTEDAAELSTEVRRRQLAARAMSATVSGSAKRASARSLARSRWRAGGTVEAVGMLRQSDVRSLAAACTGQRVPVVKGRQGGRVGGGSGRVSPTRRLARLRRAGWRGGARASGGW